MEKEIERLQELIDTHDNIVFFGGAGVSTERAEFRIFAVWTDFTIRNMIILRKPF